MAVFTVLITGCIKKTTNEEKPAEDSISVTTKADTIRTAQKIIDWEGEYKGILPCEDCDGVETSLILNFDSTFTQTTTYIGKGGPYESKGTFTLDKTKMIVTLKFEDNSMAKYKVDENRLSLLNEDESMIEGEDYILKK